MSDRVSEAILVLDRTAPARECSQFYWEKRRIRNVPSTSCERAIQSYSDRSKARNMASISPLDESPDLLLVHHKTLLA